MSKKKHKSSPALQRELRDYEKMGISLWLSGKESTPSAIVKAHKIKEEGVYMRDYVHNERGEVERLEFDFVKNNK